jgi:hypothetical protein
MASSFFCPLLPISSHLLPWHLAIPERDSIPTTFVLCKNIALVDLTMKRLLLFILLLSSLASGAPPEKEKVIGEAPATPPDKQSQALQALALEITEIQSDIDKKKKERNASKIEDDRAKLAAEAFDLSMTLEPLRKEFISVAANIDTATISETKSDSISLSGEIDSLLKPLIQELKEVTSGPRDMEALRKKIASATTRRDSAKKIVAALEKKKAASREPTFLAVLIELLESWKEKEREFDLRLDVLEVQLDDLESKSVSLLDTITEIIQKFFRSRGLHLLLAFLAFALIFYAVRKSYAIIQKVSPFHRKKQRSLSTRIVDLTFVVLAFVLAGLGAILVLYLANDWVLLTIAILFIMGTIWVSKQALPKIFEQAKLMLNLGAVREGERIIYENLPWQVRRINVYTDLVNPALTGGVRRLPIKDLLDLRSRVSESEAWFPCNKGEWLVLSDDTFGRVIEQTPEYVEIIRLGGARKFIPTGSFLEMNPVNLSKNFRINSIFGIDYKHQSISTIEVPAIFQISLTKELTSILGPEAIKNISVQFKSTATSSLDYEILADFSGEAASKYSQLHRVIQRICVDVCNERGWIIPFTQITVHQSPPEES